MSVTVRVDREGDRARLAPRGPFDLAHAATVARAVEHIPPGLEGCRSIDVDLAHLDRIDGAGAVLLAASSIGWTRAGDAPPWWRT